MTIEWREYSQPPFRDSWRFHILFCGMGIVAFGLMEDHSTMTVLFLISGYLLTAYLISLLSEHSPKASSITYGPDFARIEGLKLARSEIDDVTVGRDWIEVRWLSRERGAGSILIKKARVRKQSGDDLRHSFQDFRSWWQGAGESGMPSDAEMSDPIQRPS